MNSKTFRHDILKELFNISVGHSASILSEITNKKILLDVPDVEILKAQDREFEVGKYLPKILNGTLMVSSISFRDQITGKANLIFPADKMRTFINLCLNEEEKNYQCSNLSFTDIDFDIIKEVGNIILNSIIGGVGNYLNISLNYSLPQVKVFNKIDFKSDIENKECTYILMLYITFNIDDVEIKGAIIIDLSINSLKEVMGKIGRIEDDLCG